MLNLLSAITAISWAALAAYAASAVPGNADKGLLFSVVAVAATGAASAAAILIAPRRFFLMYSLWLSIVGAVLLIPATILSFALLLENLPTASLIDWLRVLDLAVLICLALVWPFQVRRYLHELTANA